MSERLQLRKARRLVIKIGSALLTNDGKGLDVAALGLWLHTYEIERRYA